MIRYANVEGQLKEPATGLKGVCPGCGHSLIAKCGQVKIHHWAHKQNSDCDRWWEPMTQWHQDWQNHFEPAWREVILRDGHSGAYHRADIHTPQGITIEFQHSTLSSEELESRNTFYKKVIWVVNGLPFKEKFIFTDATPNPHSPLLANYNFSVDPDGLAQSLHFYYKEGQRRYGPTGLVRTYTLKDDELSLLTEEFEQNEKLYWLFTWQRKRSGWLKSSAPVFLDFGDDSLYRIKKRKQQPFSLHYLKAVTKKDFLAKYGGQINF